MDKEFRSVLVADGTRWQVDGRLAEGRLTVEVLAADAVEATVEVQLSVDGAERHLAMVEDVAHELLGALCGRPRRRRPGSYRMARIREGQPRAWTPWTADDERLLLERWDAGEHSLDALAEVLQLGAGGVRSRLVRLGRLEEAS